MPKELLSTVKRIIIMASSSEEKKTCEPEVCFISFIFEFDDSSDSSTLKLRLCLDMKMHRLFRQIEGYAFPHDQPKYQLKVLCSDGVHKVLVEDSTPRNCWGAKPGQEYRGSIDILPRTASDEECEDDPYLTY